MVTTIWGTHWYAPDTISTCSSYITTHHKNTQMRAVSNDQSEIITYLIDMRLYCSLSWTFNSCYEVQISQKTILGKLVMIIDYDL